MTNLQNVRLQAVRGSNFKFTITGTKGGAAYTFNGGSNVYRFIAKWSLEDADADAVINLTGGSGITASSGNVVVNIPPSAFAALPYKEVVLRYELTLYDGSMTYPLMTGDLVVSPNAVRSAT